MGHPGSSTALLVIDMQESVLVGCADVEGVVGRINELARRARSKGSPVVYVQHQGPDDPEMTAATLRASEARRLVFTGAHSDYCVQTTALSALAHGYDLTLVGDAHTAQDAELPEATVPAATVIAFINHLVTSLRYPGRAVEVLPTAKVSF
jgi:nicotinamidase-related amidase